MGEGMLVKAVYLGVENYGAPETIKENRDSFRYRFEVDGKEVVLPVDGGEPDAEGLRSYPVQNVLKEGYAFALTLEDGVVRHAEELPAEHCSYVPPVSGVPGLRTVKNVLATALGPVGDTLYIFGGGWGWQDMGPAIQARTIGLAPHWADFFGKQDASFTYRDRDGDARNEDPRHSFYPNGRFNEYYYAGLDCSGYLGWMVYNVLNTESGKEGLVTGSTVFAKSLADRGLGSWTHSPGFEGGSAAESLKPGDIVSIDGHVWMALGVCGDGSTVILHSTPSVSREGQPGGGVQIGAVGRSSDCEALALADRYMSGYYPEWYRRYPVSLKSPEQYFSWKCVAAGRFRWNTGGGPGSFTDPDGILEMSAAEVLAELFREQRNLLPAERTKP